MGDVISQEHFMRICFWENKNWIVSPLGAVWETSHEFHELARISLFLFVKIRVIRGKKLRSALERETTKN